MVTLVPRPGALLRVLACAALLAPLLLGAVVPVPGGFAVTTFATAALNGTSMAFAPDGRLFVCEQAGTLEVYSATGTYIGAFHSFATNINSTGERGLLGIAFDPNFTVNNFVYVYRTRNTPTVRNQVIRLVASGDVSTGVETVILDLDDLSAATNHNGGALHFGPDGKLYVSQGENANAAQAQSVANRFGKILRINADGSIPVDNPTSFPGVAGSPVAPDTSIWALGLRNPFTFAFDPVTGRMFINDVGEVEFEEINDGLVGSNYGWTGGNSDGPASPPNANFRDPLYYYAHSGPAPIGAAITGGVFYRPAVASFPASYVGRYFFADVGGGWIYSMDTATYAVTPFTGGTANQIVDLDVGPDGALYALDRSGGAVRKIAYTGVVTQGIVPSTDAMSVAENGSAVFGVRLATDPGGTATVNVGLLYSDPTVTVSPPILTFTSGNFGTFQNVTVAAANDADAINEGATVSLTSAGLEDRAVLVTVLDDEVVAGWPQAAITLPKNGQTVSGDKAEFFGGVNNGVATTQAQFFVDGVPIFTDIGPGHYHVGSSHASWNRFSAVTGIDIFELSPAAFRPNRSCKLGLVLRVISGCASGIA